MSRRTAAGLLAVALLAGLLFVGVRQPVDFVTFRPGPTMNVLGSYAGKEIIEITGHESYPDDGELRMVTVFQSSPDRGMNLAEVLSGWIDPDVAVVPRSAVFSEDDNNQTVRKEAAQEMTSSQDNATAAALDALKIPVRSQVEITDVAKGGASDGKLRTGDVILSIDGKSPDKASDMVTLIRSQKPGTPIEVGYRRGTKVDEVTITTEPALDDPKSSRINVGIQLDYIFPFKVDIKLPDSVGGPSAGMMFALSIYDLLTPGSITGGKTIAGSGTISPDGVVGPIGGIGQKIPAAERDGARLFLVAEENCAEAARSHYDPEKIRLVKVHTLDDAISAVDAWRADPNAKLPGCAR